MITRLSHATIYVKDQDRAKAFYVDKLGFEVRTDERMGDFRWLTVGPKDQPDMELVLMSPGGGSMFDDDTAARIYELMDRGALGAGVFETKDCRKTYDELKAKGVEFTSEPEDRPYGVEATFKDDSGNWFSLTQH
jgi:catechol 2,3-dioxygenase-like lactoylglutathione lyase family enzyme